MAPAPARFFESKILEFGKAALAACSDDELVEELPSPQMAPASITQVCEKVQLVFDRQAAQVLTAILEDWSRHSAGRQVERALDVLLRACSRHREPEKLLKALLYFFFRLPEPWRSKARPILDAIIGKATST